MDLAQAVEKECLAGTGSPVGRAREPDIPRFEQDLLGRA